MQLFLRTVSGVCVPLQCAADETVRALKERIQEREGIPVEEQVLLCRGLLADSRSLTQSGLTEDSVVNLSLRLCGSGGDGGSIPGRYDLVDMRRLDSHVGGLDRSKYASLAETQMGQWDNCSLSNRPLESSRVLCCPLGFLFNAEALLTVLLKGEALPEKYTHIKSKKDVFEVTLTASLAGEAKIAKADKWGHNGHHGARFMCPITHVEMNGRHRFVALRSSGTVLSQKCLSECGADGTCPVTSTSYTEEDVIPLYSADEEVVAGLRVRLLAQQQAAKAAKKAAKAAKAAKRATDGTDVSHKAMKEEKAKKKAATAKRIAAATRVIEKQRTDKFGAAKIAAEAQRNIKKMSASSTFTGLFDKDGKKHGVSANEIFTMNGGHMAGS